MVRETYSEQETFELGKEIGEHAKGGEVFTLEGDLGVGIQRRQGAPPG